MMTKEEYKRELIRMWDSLRDDKYKGHIECHGVDCNKSCALYVDGENGISTCCLTINAFKTIEAIEKWSREHPEKKYELSEIEHEVLTSENEHLRQSLGLKERALNYNYTFAFSASPLLSKLLKFGYYKGANLETLIDDYLSKSVVVK